MCVWLAEFGGQVVGQFPTNVVRVHWRSRELLWAMAVDLMVDPAHRNKSLFIQMGRAAHADMSKSEIGLTFDFPNKNSFPGAVRFLKYRPVCQVPVLVRPLHWNRLFEKVRVPRWLSPLPGALAATGHRLTRIPAPKMNGVTVREVAEFPQTIDEFWQHAAPAHKIISVRDYKYLDWRYCRCPTRTYKICLAESSGKLVCYLVTRVLERDGLNLGPILDALVEPGRTFYMRSLAQQSQRSEKSAWTP